MAKLLTDAITGALVAAGAKRNIVATLREPLVFLEFVNTVTAASPDPYTEWKIAAPSYTVQSGDVLRYDVWIDPLNPSLGAGAFELTFTTAPNSATAAGVVDQNGVSITGSIATTGAWFSRTCDLTAIAGKVLSEARLCNLGDGVGNHVARYRNIRITDAVGTTVRVNIWLAGDPVFNVDNGSQSNAGQDARAYDAPGWLGDPLHASLAFGTDEALRDGLWHAQGLAVFPVPTDRIVEDDGIQTGGGFRAEIKVTQRELEACVEFRFRRIKSTNGYTYWKLASPNYLIAAGDYLRYETWVDPKNPVSGQGTGGVELDFSDATAGRSFSLADQNAVPLNVQPNGAVGQWVSRDISLAAVVGKTIADFDCVSEADIDGAFRALYRNIRITDTAGTTVKTNIWRTGNVIVNTDAYSLGASDQKLTEIDAPLTSDLAFNDFAQIIANPKYIVGKVFDLTLASQVGAKEIVDARRAKCTRASIDATLLKLEFADIEVAALEAVYPSKTYTVADFPDLFEGHVGRPVIDGVGQLVRIPLTWIKKSGGQWRHALCEKRTGLTYTVGAVYRAEADGQVGRVVSASEYTVSNSVGAVTGVNVVDVIFTTEQLTKNGQLYSLSADVLINSGSGVTEARLAGNEIARLSFDAGLKSDTATFSAAATYGVTHKMFADAGYVRPRKLKEIITDLLFIARGMLGKTAAGKMKLLQDQTGTPAFKFLEEADLCEVDPVDYTDSPAKVSLYYRPEVSGGEDWLATPRTRTPGGALAEKRYQNPYVRDHETADRLCDYLSKRDSVGVATRAGIHAVQLDPRDLITITGKSAWRGDKVWRITDVSRPADRNDVGLSLYNFLIHTYTAATLPAGATNVYAPDYSQTPPVAPTSLAVISQGIAVDVDGKGLASALIRAVPPTVNWAKLTAQIKNTTTGEIYQAQLLLVSGNYEAQIPNLRPNQAHTVTCWATNAAGTDGAAATPVGFTSSLWTGAPAAPTGLGGNQTGVDQIQVSFTPSSSGSVVIGYIPYVQIGAGSFVAQPMIDASLYRHHLSSGYGSSYTFKFKAVDRFGNQSADSSTVSVTPTAYLADSYISPLGVGTASIANNAVRDGKINKNISTVSTTVGAGNFVHFGFGSGAAFGKIYAYRVYSPTAAHHQDLALYAGDSSGSPSPNSAVTAKNVSGATRDVACDLVEVPS